MTNPTADDLGRATLILFAYVADGASYMVTKESIANAIAEARSESSFRGITREQAIGIAEEVFKPLKGFLNEEAAKNARHGMGGLLAALAAAGAFSDGKNMDDRLVGRLKLP